MADLSSTTAKNFLTNAEKQLGSLVYVVSFGALALGGLLFKDAILGVLNFGITLVGNTIMLGIGAAVAFWVWMTLTSPRFWTEMRTLNYQFVRSVSSVLMKANPFGRMRAFANEFLQQQWESFNTAAERVESQKFDVVKKIEKNRDALTTSKQTVASLQKRHQQPDGSWDSEDIRNTFRLEAQRILLLEEGIKKSESRLQRLTILIGVLDKWRSTFKFEIEMTRMTADSLESDYNEANSTTNALEAASNAFGHGDAAQADKEVREYIEKLTSDRMARADVLMKQIPELTAVGNLKGDIAEEETLRRLRVLDTDAQQALVEVQEDHRQLSAGSTSLDTLIRTKAEAVATRRFLK